MSFLSPYFFLNVWGLKKKRQYLKQTEVGLELAMHLRMTLNPILSIPPPRNAGIPGIHSLTQLPQNAPFKNNLERTLATVFFAVVFLPAWWSISINFTLAWHFSQVKNPKLRTIDIFLLFSARWGWMKGQDSVCFPEVIKREIVPGTGNLDNHMRSVRSWTLDENLLHFIKRAQLKLCFKHLFSHTKTRSVLTPHQRNFSATETITENHRKPKQREQVSMGGSSLNRQTCNTIRTSMNITEEWAKGCKSQRTGKICRESVSHRNYGGASCMTPQQYGRLNKT